MLVKIKKGYGKHHVGTKTYRAGDELEVSEATFEAGKGKFEKVLSPDELAELARKRAEEAKTRADQAAKDAASVRKSADDAAKKAAGKA